MIDVTVLNLFIYGKHRLERVNSFTSVYVISLTNVSKYGVSKCMFEIGTVCGMVMMMAWETKVLESAIQSRSFTNYGHSLSACQLRSCDLTQLLRYDRYTLSG